MVKALDLLYQIILNLDPKQFLVFCIFALIFILCGVVYKLAGNHINHLTQAITSLDTTLTNSTDRLCDKFDTLDQNSRKEHGKMLECISRLIGRTD